MYRNPALFAGCITLAGVGLVVGQVDKNDPRPPCPPPPLVAALDADQDGTISAEEIADASAALLTLDVDGDGALSREEVRPDGPPCGRRRGHGPLIMRHDTDGDGVVGRAEFITDVTDKFVELDADGDGDVDQEDLDAICRFGPRLGRHLMRHDTDGDGIVTEAEFLAFAESRFDALDTNDDDQVDQDEADAARPRRRGPRWNFGHGPRGGSDRGFRGGR